MMFQRALPEVNGFGVSTCTPGLTRSDQFSMCLGLPLRTMITATESVTKPLVAFWFQLGETMPALTSRSTSGSSEKSTTSACSPLTTARLCSPEGPKDWLKPTPLPGAVAWQEGTGFSNGPWGG